MYDAVLFDVDGTLTDSAPGIFHALRDALAAMGTDPAGVDLSKYLGPPLRKTFADFYTRESDIEKAVALYRASYREKGAHECRLYPGVQEMLAALSAAGVLLFTATSKPVEVVTPILHEQGIAEYFRVIGGASMGKSRDTKTDVIRWLLARPELQGKRILMVGDRKDDMQGAKDCALDAAGALYGYGSREELLPFGPVFLAGSCPELEHFILDGETK
ncbi:MAG: HAD hydrolase-like protein [Faecalibacterium sp.]|jgi:phosphoglycolate phosphatase|nr:HAD hydrolase-like protein [Faecalibacterium sp.]